MRTLSGAEVHGIVKVWYQVIDKHITFLEFDPQGVTALASI